MAESAHPDGNAKGGAAGDVDAASHICCYESCDKVGTLRCSRCRAAWYCSKGHQKKAWRAGHRGECKEVKADLKGGEGGAKEEEETELSRAIAASLLKPGYDVNKDVSRQGAPVLSCVVFKGDRGQTAEAWFRCQ